MHTIVQILIGLIAFLHFYIFIFEAFFWEQRGPKIFHSFPKELFPKTKTMAFNQGVYNLFLAVGLVWSFFISDPEWSKNVASFFLGCVGVAGVAGATVERKILLVQTVPALIALVLLWLA